VKGPIEIYTKKFRLTGRSYDRPAGYQMRANLRLFELSNVLVCFDHSARIIINANHSIM
jgi:hypothetical protein